MMRRGAGRLRCGPWLTKTDSGRREQKSRRLDGRWRGNPLEESPGSTEIRCRLTAGGGDPRDSATENKPPRVFSRGKGETVR
jgi:hypothetical protein